MARKETDEFQLNQQIASRIRELRIKCEPIQAKFAKENLLDRQLLSRWESTTDERGVSIHTIKRFCNMIGISLADFFDDELFR